MMMGRDVVSAKLDIIFKKIFSENTDLLLDFVAGLLEIPSGSIKNISLKNTELSPENPDGKFSRLDLNMTLNDTLVNVEIQINPNKNFSDRTMFYWAKLFTSELESGQNYIDLKPAITINILDFVLFPDRKDYHAEVIPVIKDTGEVYSDKFHIHIFELKKLHKNYEAKSRREMWLNFINSDSEEEFDMLKKLDDPVMNKAVRVIIDMSQDTQIRERARLREKALHDEAFYIEGARAEGRAEGIEEGMAKGIEKGKAEGIEEGKVKGREEGRAEGIEEGKVKGREEGRAEGIEEGIARGIEKGIAETLAEVMQDLKRYGMSDEEIEKILGKK